MKSQQQVKWQDVILTKDASAVKGKKHLELVKATASKFFGKEEKLRTKCRESLQKEAAKIGATIVLIQNDNFGNSPVNNVTMDGEAYQ